MIRVASINDLESLYKIENNCFDDDKYSKENLKYELSENPFAKTLVYEEDSIIKGFVIYMITFNSATILQIATDLNYRKQGIADKLLKESIKDLIDKGYGEIETLTLELRVSNLSAYNLYLKNNFKKILIKPKYYDNGEDAIYMVRSLI